MISFSSEIKILGFLKLRKTKSYKNCNSGNIFAHICRGNGKGIYEVVIDSFPFHSLCFFSTSGVFYGPL